MSTRFYFRDIEVKNFRSFDSLKIDRFKRINILGGFNGVGKTALLETLFLCLDRRNPLALLKPISWRRYEISSSIDPAQFLRNPKNSEAEISFSHRTGESRILLTHETPPSHVSVSMAGATPPPGMGTTDPSQKGMSIRTFAAGSQLVEETFLLPTMNGAVGNISRFDDKPLPLAQFISIATRGPTAEVATRFSNIVRQRRVGELIEPLRELVPSLSNIQALQDGNVSQIYAEVDGDFLPIQYLGDGFQNLFQTLVGIMNARDGVIFLDEIDAAIHYSKIAFTWTLIARMADKENCQIFASTHSRECINSAALGIRKAGRTADFQYLRLERNDKGHFAVSYEMDDIENAEAASIEIR